MSERWKPKNLEVYWSVIDTTPMHFAWQGNPLEIARWEAGNVFKTQDQALIASINIKSLLLSLHEPVTDCNQLPKLTAEVFDRPDCPEWAKYAAVHDEKLFFTDQEPGINEYGHLASANDAARIERISIVPFKSSEDYLSQVIKRPTKDAFDKLLKKHAQQQTDKIWQKARERRLSEQYHNGPEETKLSDWCKVGEWVYHDSDGYYYAVKRVDIEEDDIRISDNAIEYPYTANEIKTFFSPARLRPYNAVEMKALVGKVIEVEPGQFSLCLRVKGLWAEFLDDCDNEDDCARIISYDCDMLKHRNIIDGKPCGVLEHLNENGEWVK